MAEFNPSGRSWTSEDVRSWFPSKPGFTKIEDYFNPNTYSGGWEDVRSQLSDMVLQGMGQFATDRTRNRLGQDIIAFQGLNHLNQVLSGQDPATAGGSSWADLTANFLPGYLNQGTVPGLGQRTMQSPSDVFNSLLTTSQNAQTGGNDSLWAAINDSPELLAGLREYGSRNFGGFAARRFQDMVDKMSRAGNTAGIGEGYTTALYGSPYTNQTAPPLTTPAAPVGGTAPGATPGATPGTTPSGPPMPIEQAITNKFQSEVGRPPTAREQQFWQNKMNTAYGGGAEGLNAILLDIQNSQPAARYKATGIAAPVVETAAQAGDFYDWLFGGQPDAPPRNEWISTYTQKVLGIPVHSGTLRYPR